MRLIYGLRIFPIIKSIDECGPLRWAEIIAQTFIIIFSFEYDWSVCLGFNQIIILSTPWESEPKTTDCELIQLSWTHRLSILIIHNKYTNTHTVRSFSDITTIYASFHIYISYQTKTTTTTYRQMGAIIRTFLLIFAWFMRLIFWYGLDNTVIDGIR